MNEKLHLINEILAANGALEKLFSRRDVVLDNLRRFFVVFIDRNDTDGRTLIVVAYVGRNDPHGRPYIVVVALIFTDDCIDLKPKKLLFFSFHKDYDPFKSYLVSSASLKIVVKGL
jgi:hypothetical protein